MKKIILIFLLLLSPVYVMAETRNIYIGDIISLHVEFDYLSSEELNRVFRPFEIVDYKEVNNGYQLSLRTFETGEHTIRLGDQEMVINVHSTLDDIQREDLFEGDGFIIEAGYPIYWRLFLYISIGIFILSSIYLIFKEWAKKEKSMAPLPLFMRQAASLSVERDDFFVDLTYYFKEYIGSLYQCRIIGKTSEEIAYELQSIGLPDTLRHGVWEWMTECDRLKFSGIAVSSENKNSLYLELLDWAEKINACKKEETT